jgi:hypothetical protein
MSLVQEEEEQRQAHADSEASQPLQPAETAPVIPPTVHTPLAPTLPVPPATEPAPDAAEVQQPQQPSSMDGDVAKELQDSTQPPATPAPEPAGATRVSDQHATAEPDSTNAARSGPSPPPPPSARLMSMLSKGGAASSPSTSQAPATSQAGSSGGAGRPPALTPTSKPEADGGASDQAVRGTHTTATVSSGGFGADSGLTGTFLDDLVAMARKGSAGAPAPPSIRQPPAKASQPQPATRQAPQPAPTASDITQFGSHRLGEESDDSVTSPGPGDVGRRGGARGRAGGRGRSAGGKGGVDGVLGSAGVSSDGSSEAATAAAGMAASQQGASGQLNLSRQGSSSGAVPRSAPAEQQQQQGPAPAPSIAAEERVAAATAAAAGALAALSELIPPVVNAADATAGAGPQFTGGAAGGKQRGGGSKGGSAPATPPVGQVQGNSHAAAGAGQGVDASHLEQLLSQVGT